MTTMKLTSTMMVRAMLLALLVLPWSHAFFIPSKTGGNHHATLEWATTRPFVAQERFTSTVFRQNAATVADDEQPTFTTTPSTTNDLSFTEQYTLVESPDEIWLQPCQRLVTFGDVHGDIRQLRRFLQIAGVIAAATDTEEDPDTWIGGNTVCVQCGDILDRGAQELECFRLLASLSRQAVEQGGCLVLLHGNHEVMNADGDLRYVDPAGDLEFQAALQHAADTEGGVYTAALQQAEFSKENVGQAARFLFMKPTGLLAEPLLKNFKVAVKVGRTVCVHAGLEAHHVDKYGGIEGMNLAARQWFAGQSHIPECLYREPVWMRTYSDPSDAAPDHPQAQAKIGMLMQA
jgi:hypothetical protein